MVSDAVNSGEAAELADAIGQLHALNGAVLSAMFDIVRVYDEEAAFLPDGATTMATWLAYALGVTFTTATGYVRVARAMPDLPLISAAFREGRLCFEQVRALIPVATADNEAELLAQASGLTANQIERMVRRMLAVSTEEAALANDRRGLWFRWSSQDLTLRLAGRLPAAEGAVVVTAIERLACGGERPDPGSAHLDQQPFSAFCADALVELASASLADDADVDRACIVVHADVEALAPGEGGTASLECGLPLASETLKRLACGGRLQLVVEAADGRPLGIGRQSRVVPSAMLRLLRDRDQGCRFPGCGRTRWLHAHHIRHWAHLGRTDLDNLVMLCGSHHRFVHEGRWRIEGDPSGELRFITRWGTPFRVAPPALRPEVAERINPVVHIPLWVPTPARC